MSRPGLSGSDALIPAPQIHDFHTSMKDRAGSTLLTTFKKIAFEFDPDPFECRRNLTGNGRPLVSIPIPIPIHLDLPVW
jgi:hypothetical protein